MTESPGARDEACAQIDLLAAWSGWLPFLDAMRSIDRLLGVYLMRTGGRIVYVRMAGKRTGTTGNMPRGMRGRLVRYASGKAAASGFGDAALDRALADVDFLRNQLETLYRSERRQTIGWARDAIA
ncbi:hypothetical protein C5C13_06245 [Clavibacter michiganensis]|nr:hypothetical protein C5C13_06245 [Clavibacter michiganensis]